jgi:hypothetical protein
MPLYVCDLPHWSAFTSQYFTTTISLEVLALSANMSTSNSGDTVGESSTQRNDTIERATTSKDPELKSPAGMSKQTTHIFWFCWCDKRLIQGKTNLSFRKKSWPGLKCLGKQILQLAMTIEAKGQLSLHLPHLLPAEPRATIMGGYVTRTGLQAPIRLTGILRLHNIALTLSQLDPAIQPILQRILPTTDDTSAR